jgi:hypothetical protein
MLGLLVSNCKLSFTCINERTASLTFVTNRPELGSHEQPTFFQKVFTDEEFAKYTNRSNARMTIQSSFYYGPHSCYLIDNVLDLVTWTSCISTEEGRAQWEQLYGANVTNGFANQNPDGSWGWTSKRRLPLDRKVLGACYLPITSMDPVDRSW